MRTGCLGGRPAGRAVRRPAPSSWARRRRPSTAGRARRPARCTLDREPWWRGLTPVGPAGRAAAAAAAGDGVVHQGGDGAGSIRIPTRSAACSGSSRPTADAAADQRAGLSSQGPIARTVRRRAAARGDGRRCAPRGWTTASTGCAPPGRATSATPPSSPRCATWPPPRRSASPRSAAPWRTPTPACADPWPVVDVIWAWSQSRDEDERRSRCPTRRRRPVIERGWSLTE